MGNSGSYTNPTEHKSAADAPVMDPRSLRERAPGLRTHQGLPARNPRLAVVRGVGRRGGLNSQVLHRPTFDARGEPESVKRIRAAPQLQQLENVRASGALMDSLGVRNLRAPRPSDATQI